ncbi:hypothetical protein B0J13DRAFT_122615 [Dactylonectria estremocensis]|uniref:Secreted protein n=1 Tax=Dactylonectria estremocensis TaxID=1079267 RepID=A0A9P9FE43_9HYPO|nr:hypothetical protein B0J13DRAFT_122615 [Dactylonectria estremocensis]
MCCNWAYRRWMFGVLSLLSLTPPPEASSLTLPHSPRPRHTTFAFACMIRTYRTYIRGVGLLGGLSGGIHFACFIFIFNPSGLAARGLTLAAAQMGSTSKGKRAACSAPASANTCFLKFPGPVVYRSRRVDRHPLLTIVSWPVTTRFRNGNCMPRHKLLAACAYIPSSVSNHGTLTYQGAHVPRLAYVSLQCRSAGLSGPRLH